MGKRRLPAICAVFFSLALDLALATLQVEHSFDGSTFVSAGQLVGDAVSDVELSWQRPEFTKSDLALLNQAVMADGLYSVRVTTGKGVLLTSVPAKCLTGPVLKEQAELHADRNGALVAFNYAVPSCLAALLGGADSSEAAGAAAGAAARPERLAVRVVLPAPGPMLTVPELVGEFVDVSAEMGDVGAAAGAAAAAGAYDPNAKPRAASAPAAGRKGAAPPPDERSWLQKNWLFVAAAGMMVLNVIAKANAPPGAPGAPGAGGAGGGGGGGGPRRG